MKLERARDKVPKKLRIIYQGGKYKEIYKGKMRKRIEVKGLGMKDF